MMLEVLLRAREHLRGRCTHHLARQVPSSQPDEQRVEIVLDGLLVHRHAARFALASQLAVLQLLLSFRDAPLDLRLPESAPRQLIFGDRTLLRFGRARFVCVHPYAKYRSARAPAAFSARTACVASPSPLRPVGSTTPKSPPPPCRRGARYADARTAVALQRSLRPQATELQLVDRTRKRALFNTDDRSPKNKGHFHAALTVSFRTANTGLFVVLHNTVSQVSPVSREAAYPAVAQQVYRLTAVSWCPIKLLAALCRTITPKVAELVRVAYGHTLHTLRASHSARP